MTFPQLDNPWFSGHNHENKADPLDLNWPDDYDNHTVNSCSYREFKNVTVFSHAEFIHDYINFRYSITQGDLTPIFPTFAKPNLNLDFYMNADSGST